MREGVWRVVHLIAVLALASCGHVTSKSGKAKTDRDSGGELDSGAESSDEPDGSTGPCPGSALECCVLPHGSGFQCEEDFGPASCSAAGWTCPYGGSPVFKCSALVCVTLPADGGSSHGSH